MTVTDAQPAVEAGSQAGTQTIPLAGIAKTAARRMVTAWEAPVFHLGVDIDMRGVLASKGGGITVSDLIVGACATALAAHPRVNATFAEDAITLHEQVNVGLAVDTPKGLMVPVIRDASTIGIEGIAAARRDLVERAHAGALKMADITEGTFTVSNLGMLGVDAFDAILNVPQVAILAIGATSERAVQQAGALAWVPTARFTLTCDHRALDGATGARFLATLRGELERGLESSPA
jgi:pyruvate dehydrogenase E2 component (dihydrolipoamide acetyltransferase)